MPGKGRKKGKATRVSHKGTKRNVKWTHATNGKYLNPEFIPLMTRRLLSLVSGPTWGLWLKPEPLSFLPTPVGNASVSKSFPKYPAPCESQCSAVTIFKTDCNIHKHFSYSFRRGEITGKAHLENAVRHAHECLKPFSQTRCSAISKAQHALALSL